MTQVLVCCEECRGTGVLEECDATVFYDDGTGVPYHGVLTVVCDVCGGEGEVWMDDPPMELRILLDEPGEPGFVAT